MTRLPDIAHLLCYAAALLVIGAAAMHPLLRAAWPGDAALAAREQGGRLLTRVIFVAVLVGFLGQCLGLCGQAMQLIDEGESLGLSHFTMALGSGWGAVWYAQMAAALLAIVAWLPGRHAPLVGWRLMPLAALGLAATLPLAGHPRVLPVGMVAGVLGGALHLLGAGAWIGGLTLLLLLAWRGPEEGREGRAAALIARFSTMATFAAPLTLVTGSFIAWQTVGSIGALTSTSYGRILLLKVAAVVVVGLLGGYHYKVSVPRLTRDPADRSFRRTAFAEVAVSLVVLVATAILVSLPAPGLE